MIGCESTFIEPPTPAKLFLPGSVLPAVMLCLHAASRTIVNYEYLRVLLHSVNPNPDPNRRALGWKENIDFPRKSFLFYLAQVVGPCVRVHDVLRICHSTLNRTSTNVYVSTVQRPKCKSKSVVSDTTFVSTILKKLFPFFGSLVFCTPDPRPAMYDIKGQA